MTGAGMTMMVFAINDYGGGGGVVDSGNALSAWGSVRMVDHFR